MLLTISVMLASVVFSQQEGFSTTHHRLAPPLIAAPTTARGKTPNWLADGKVVAEPKQLLQALRETQQDSWQRFRSVKGRAWVGSVAYGNGATSIIWLKEFSFSKEPRQKKELKFGSNKLMEERLAGRAFDPAGLDPDEKDALYCIDATIETPVMSATARFLKYMRPGNFELVSVAQPNSKRISPFILDGSPFGFPMTPTEFHDTYLPSKIRQGGKLTVTKDRELVELRLSDPQSPKYPSVYLFDLAKHGSAIATYVRGVKREIVLREIDDVWLPDSINEVGLARYVEMRFFDWKVNPPLAANEFSLKSLPVSAETPIKDNRRNIQILFRDWQD